MTVAFEWIHSGEVNPHLEIGVMIISLYIDNGKQAIL